MPKLYNFEGSPSCRKVRAVVALTGLKVEEVNVDLMKGAQKEPAYLALNPNGVVPTLVDDQTVIWESNAIITYLADKARSPLWPEGPARFAVLQWLAWEAGVFAPPAATLIWERLLKGAFGIGGPDAAVVKAAEERLSGAGRVLDEHLRGRSFIVGNALSLADIAIASRLTNGEAAQFPLGGFQNIKAWTRRLQDIPAWRNSVAS